MKAIEQQIVLLRNLIERMEYNEKQSTWKLSGSITSGEFKALQDAFIGCSERIRYEDLY